VLRYTMAHTAPKNQKMKTQHTNAAESPAVSVQPTLRPFLVSFVPSRADELPENDFQLQCGFNQRRIVVHSDRPENALAMATEILEKNYPFEHVITRVDDEAGLRQDLAVLEHVKAGRLAPASLTDDEDDWDRFDDPALYL
jgi:hypothetical protein